eukprot:1156004-Pelagomonas_calceolata.AAC.5
MEVWSALCNISHHPAQTPRSPGTTESSESKPHHATIDLHRHLTPQKVPNASHYLNLSNCNVNQHPAQAPLSSRTLKCRPPP